MRTDHNWIMTFSGRKFWPTDPHPDDIDIVDIAHALSKVTRYTGHTLNQDIYSVGQHCVYVSRHLPEELKLWGLLHDANEAYLCDHAKPIKDELPDCAAFEERMDRCIAQKFGLVWPCPPEVKEVDRRMLVTEAQQLMHPNFLEWKGYNGYSPIKDLFIGEWPPWMARLRFLETFEHLTGT